MTQINKLSATLIIKLCLCLIVIASPARCESAINNDGDLIVASASNVVSSLDLFDQYEPRFWDNRDGLPHNKVTAIYFDHQDYLWLGSHFGLTRFSGKDFALFDPYNTPNLKSDTIKEILQDNEDHFWVATGNGLYRSNGRDLIQADIPHGLKEISSMAKSEDGSLWIATKSGLVRYSEGPPKFFGKDHGLIQNLIQNLRPFGNKLVVFGQPKSQVFDPTTERFEDLPRNLQNVEPLATSLGGLLSNDDQGYMWYQNDHGIFRFQDPDSPELVLKDDSAINPSIRLLGMDNSNAVWTSSSDGTVTRYFGGREESIKLYDRYGITSVDTFLHHGGDYWLGADEGLVLLKKRTVKNYSVLNGLPSHFISSIDQLDTDLFVVGTGDGPAIIDRANQKTTVININIANTHIRSVCAAPDGGFWISNEHHGPLLIDENFVDVHYSAAHPLWAGLERDGKNAVYAMSYDSAGNFWIGTSNGAIKIRENGSFTEYNKDSVPPIPAVDVRDFYEHNDGSIWMGCEGGGLVILRKSGDFQHFTTANGLSGNEVFALVGDPDGKTVWAATDNGLTRIRDGTLRSLDHTQGLPRGTLNQILIDNKEDFWVTSLSGVHRVSIKDLNAAIDDKSHHIPVMTVDSNDGMLNAETNGESQPAGIIDDQGNLWIPTIKAASTFNPRQFANIPPPTPPIIERITLDREVIYDNSNPTNSTTFLQKKLRLAPGQGDLIEIELAAPSVSLTDNAFYQIRLGGDGDSSWLPVDGNRAIYTTLKPGDYAFQAKVATAKNIWSSPLTAYQVERPPYFYQTWVFFTLVAISGVVIALLLHTRRMRIASTIQQLEQNAALISERERIARDMHDDLGSRLTHISLIAEFSEREGRPLTNEQTHELNVATRQAARAMEEIVWAAKPDNDSSDNTINYLIQYAEHQLAVADIACRNDALLESPDSYISPEHRNTVFLTFKEAVNNIIKHSKADEVWLSVSLDDGTITVGIADNGQGFDADGVHGAQHNGLTNMAKRMADIGGHFSISSTPGKGTTVEIGFSASRKPPPQFFRK